MADTWKTLVDRTTAASSMLADNNDRNACINALKGGDRDDAPTTTLEEIASRQVLSVGDVVMKLDYSDISASFPFLCLSKADTVLAAANYVDYVTYLRALKLRYDPCSTNKTAFDVTGWAIAANVATLTLSNTTAENKILAALAEDELVSGSFSNWRTITLASAIGDITAGDYAITEISTASRTISFAFTASNNSGSGSYTVEFYPYRIVGSTTTARHFQVAGRGFITVGDTDSEWIGGLRRRDRNGDHAHYSGTTYDLASGDRTNVMPYGNDTSGVGAKGFSGALSTSNRTQSQTSTPITGRTGATTDIRGMGIYVYVYVGTYAA